MRRILNWQYSEVWGRQVQKYLYAIWKTFILKTDYTVLALGSLHESHLVCNYHIGDNYYRGSFSNKYPSCGLYLLWYSQEEKFHARPMRGKARQVKWLIKWIDKLVTMHSHWLAILWKKSRHVKMKQEANSVKLFILHDTLLQWHLEWRKRFLWVQEANKPPTQSLRYCKILISHLLRLLPGDSRMIQPPSWQHPTLSQQARLLKNNI